MGLQDKCAGWGGRWRQKMEEMEGRGDPYKFNSKSYRTKGMSSACILPASACQGLGRLRWAPACMFV